MADNQIKYAPNRLGALGKYLNLKKSFDDAVRQHQWQLEHEGMQQRGATERTRIGAASSLATYGGMSGGDLNQFINTGQFPESYNGPASLASGGMDQSNPDQELQDLMQNYNIPEEQKADYQIVPKANMYRGKLRRYSTLERKPEAIQREKKFADIEANRTGALSLVDQLEQSYGTAFKDAPESGPGIYGYGAKKSVESRMQTNPEVTSYNDTREAFLSMLARGLGEKGVLTNQDIDRVKRAIPNQWRGRRIAKGNFKAIRSIINQGIERYRKASGESGSNQKQSDPLGIR